MENLRPSILHQFFAFGLLRLLRYADRIRWSFILQNWNGAAHNVRLQKHFEGAADVV